MLYGADALAPSHRSLPTAELPSSTATPRVAERARGLRPSFLHRIGYVLSIQYYAKLGKSCEKSCKALGRRNFLGITSPWMMFRNTLKVLCKQWRKDGRTLFPKEKGRFPRAVCLYPSQQSPLWWVPWGDLPTPASLLLLLGHWGNHETSWENIDFGLLVCLFSVGVCRENLGQIKKKQSKDFSWEEKKKTNLRNPHCVS